MIAIKNSQKVTFNFQLEVVEKYVMVSIRDLKISEEKQNITAVILCHTFDYKLDEQGIETNEVINKRQESAKPIYFTKAEMNALMQGLNATITDMESFDTFQKHVLLYLAQQDSYFGLSENWEIV